MPVVLPRATHREHKLVKQLARTYSRPMVKRISWYGLIAMTLALAVFVIGLGSTLIVIGAWCLAVGFARIFPTLGNPASWAAAVVSELTILLTISVLFATVRPHAHDPSTNLLILATPMVAGIVLIAAGAVLGRSRRAEGNSLGGVALTVTALGLAIAAFVSSRGPSFDLAWAMSGDARNHILLVRQIFSRGGVTFDTLRQYPAAINAVTALITGSSPRIGLDNGELLLHDARALADTYLLSVIAVACLMMAVLAQFIPKSVRQRPKLPFSVAVVLLAASTMSASPLLLGTALVDGFVTAYGTLVITLASVVLAMRSCRDPRFNIVAYLLLAPAMIIAFVSWTILAIVPVSLTVATTIVAIRRWLTRYRYSVLSTRAVMRGGLCALPMIATVVVMVAIILNLKTLRTVFLFPGSIVSPGPRILAIIALILVGLLIGLREHGQRMQLSLAIIVIVGACLVMAWLSSLAGGGLNWTYYSAKTVWLVSGALIWVCFLPLLLATSNSAETANTPISRIRTTATAGVFAVAILAALGLTTTAPNPIPDAMAGWNQPSAQVIVAVSREAKRHSPFVFWEWSDPGNERLGNFWAALVWGADGSGRYTPSPAALPGGISAWAYRATAEKDELCQVAQAYPRLTIVTRSPNLDPRLEKACRPLVPYVRTE